MASSATRTADSGRTSGGGGLLAARFARIEARGHPIREGAGGFERGVHVRELALHQLEALPMAWPNCHRSRA